MKKNIDELIRKFQYRVELNNERMSFIIGKNDKQLEELQMCYIILSLFKSYTKEVYQLTFENSVYLELIKEIDELKQKYNFEPFRLGNSVEELLKQQIEIFERDIHSNCISSSTNMICNLASIWEYEIKNKIIKLLNSLI